MLKHKRKTGLMAAIFAAALTLSPISAIQSYATDSSIINETSEKQTVTKGVTLEHITRFTTAGWLDFQVMRVDMTDPYVSVDTLTNAESIGKLSSVKTMAVQKNAVAAVNASFFTPDGGTWGHPVGTIVQSSTLLATSNDHNRYSNSMASLTISKLNELLFAYGRTDMSLSNQAGAKITVAQYNKYNDLKFTDFTVFDRKWDTTAVGASPSMPDIFQMVVADGKVTQFLTAQPAALIPQNGYVVVTRSAGAKMLQKTFVIGDAVSFNIGTTPGWADVKATVSGSCMLVQDGTIPAVFSFTAPDIVKASPKTAVGASQDGKTLYLVTVDGRQTSSIGLSLADMAFFMQSIGAYNAINMDGGGSTTMVARPEAEKSVKIFNSPSDGIARAVSTALGIFSTAPQGTLAGMVIETTDRYLFNNTSRAFTVKGVDSFHNPADVDPAAIKWSVSGVKGTFSGNVFHPTTFGEGKVTAKIGTVTESINISVLSAPARLILSSKSLKLPVGATKTISVTGVNLKGYQATIDPLDIKWTASGAFGSFADGVLTALQRGSGYIDAAFGNAHATCTVSVSADVSQVIDVFEEPNGTFTSYPNTVKGAYEISAEQKVSGNASGKLTYDFTNTEGTRAAYMLLPDGGLQLEPGASKLGLQVYTDHQNSGWLRAELVDADGKKQVADFVKTMDWTGWKAVEASVDNVKMPARLTRLYLVQVNPVADNGSLYLDDLSVTYSGYPPVDASKIPADTVPVDDTNKAVSFTKATADSFRFGVLGQTRAPKNALESKLMTRFAQKVDQLLEVGAVVGTGSHEAVAKLITKKPFLITSASDLKSTAAADDAYGVQDMKNSRLIKLDTTGNGLRKSDPVQWQQFLADLDSFKGKNVFILMESDPEKFSDKLELALFKKTLSDYRLKTLRNVWVIYQGAKNGSFMEKGVKYLSAAGYEVDGLTADKTDAATYLLITVKGNAVTYIFRPIL